LETITLKSSAISCEHCVMAIKRAVSKLPGVQSVEGNPSTKNVVVSFDPARTSVGTISKTMEEEGYAVDK